MKTIIISGLSGAGKSTAINCMEDLGYYCIDNMPPALVKNFMELVKKGSSDIDKAAFVMDARGGEFFREIRDCLNELKRGGVDYKLVFLEASDDVLIRRFNETRRAHPLSGNGPTIKGITKERELLADIRKAADFVLDTSNMKNAKLKDELVKIAESDEETGIFTINIESFGYKNGLPLNADIVLDMRFVPNPYYVPSLKKLTGNSKRVRDYVLRHDEVQRFVADITKLINNMIPCYVREGKYNLNIAFGCTGGQHRSVVMANEFARILEHEGKRVTLTHRDL